jgi:maltooligosyltrehalose trehalohydrolase
MTPPRVWAPFADRVELDRSGTRERMRPLPGGWYQAETELAHGDDYAFVLDGGDPLPDPRSRWQPAGVHGPSRWVDPTTFPWTDGGWRGRDLATSVVYELHVGTFTEAGTFDAAVERLDHLVDLGVGHVEVLPVAAFSGDRGWGYDGVGLYAVHEPYGGPAAFARFVDACHARGLAVVLDVVYNHLGPAGNYLDRFGPYFTDRYRTPWGKAVNYDDAGSDEVRAFAVDNALMWCRDHHVDALRLDAVHAIYDQSAVHLLEELTSAVHDLGDALGRPLHVIAESDLNDPRVVTPVERGGYGMDAQWSDDFHHALHAALTGERDGYYSDFGALADVATALRGAFVYTGQHAAYRGRRHGRPVEGLPGTRFLGYLQNHDQIGNRAAGERSGSLLSPGLLQVAAALVLTAPFVPMLFQGEEWGASTPFQYFTAHDDPELAEAVRTGRREEFAAFGWKPEDVPDPQDPATFERSRLDWSEPAEAPHDRLLAWHRDLIALRARTPDLTGGDLTAVRVDVDEEARTLLVGRGAVHVAANLAAEPRDVALPADHQLAIELASDAGVTVGDGGVALPPESVAVLIRR